jgi:hypothetical protein
MMPGDHDLSRGPRKLVSKVAEGALISERPLQSIKAMIRAAARRSSATMASAAIEQTLDKLARVRAAE